MGHITQTTTALDPASQRFVEESRGQAASAAQFALDAPGQFFLGPDPRSVQDIIQPFQDPFQQQVIDATRQEFDILRDRAVGGAGGTNQQAILAGAQGGSRQGVAEGVRLGELDRAQTSQIAGLLSQNFQQAVSNAIPFSERQRALAQQQAQEPLFRQQQAQQFRNLGLGQTGQTTTTETPRDPGGFFRKLLGAGLTIGGSLLFPAGAPAFAAAGGAVAGGGRENLTERDIFANQQFRGQFR